MTQHNNEDLLLDLYKIHAYIPNDAKGNPLTPFGNFCAGYEAAKADSEREIVELKARALEESNKYVAYCDLAETKIIELQAHINVLREALKGNDFPYSANLDIYNSVRFTDAPYGTMIMESKIVRWLCRNRAKDYFDKMVEGK